MNIHKNAPQTPRGREAMVRAVMNDGLSRTAVARQFRATPKTVAKWVKRFREQGADGMHDRSSRPHSSPSQTAFATCAEIERLRRDRYTQDQIAAATGASRNRQPQPQTLQPEPAGLPRTKRAKAQI
jgi:transposase